MNSFSIGMIVCILYSLIGSTIAGYLYTDPSRDVRGRLVGSLFIASLFVASAGFSRLLTTTPLQEGTKIIVGYWFGTIYSGITFLLFPMYVIGQRISINKLFSTRRYRAISPGIQAQ